MWRHMMRRRMGSRSVAPRRRRPISKRLLCFERLEDRSLLTLLGQQLFPADYPWNQNIANAAGCGQLGVDHRAHRRHGANPS